MTGPWQILGPARVPLREMVAIDYLYVANWSLWTDVKILLRTVPARHRTKGPVNHTRRPVTTLHDFGHRAGIRAQRDARHDARIVDRADVHGLGGDHRRRRLDRRHRRGRGRLRRARGPHSRPPPGERGRQPRAQCRDRARARAVAVLPRRGRLDRADRVRDARGRRRRGPAGRRRLRRLHPRRRPRPRAAAPAARCRVRLLPAVRAHLRRLDPQLPDACRARAAGRRLRSRARHLRGLGPVAADRTGRRALPRHVPSTSLATACGRGPRRATGGGCSPTGCW